MITSSFITKWPLGQILLETKTSLHLPNLFTGWNKEHPSHMNNIIIVAPLIVGYAWAMESKTLPFLVLLYFVDW